MEKSAASAGARIAVASLLREGQRQLRQAGVESWRQEGFLLLEYALGVQRTALLLEADRLAEEAQIRRWREALRRRCAREPLAYITGSREFWSLDFLVSPAVLIPRPETEFLLEQVLAAAKTGLSDNGLLLDLCTGSGVIAVVLARELERPVLATDISVQALEIARENCTKHGVLDRVSLLAADLFHSLAPQRQFALIIANPPYVASGDLPALDPEVRVHEPSLALEAGEEGMTVIRSILAKAGAYLQPEGRLFLEIGADQENLVLQAASVAWRECRIERDLTGRPRVFHGCPCGQ